VDHRDPVVLAHPAVDDAADDQPSHVVVPVERGGPELEPVPLVELGGGDRLEQGLEERGQGLGLVGERPLGDALARVGVEHRELELLHRRVQIDEEVVDLVEHLGGAGVLAVDLVDDHHRGEPGLERLLQHEAGLGQRPLRRIHQQQHPVHEGQGPLDLAPEVGVAGRVHDIDLHALVVDGRVLGHDRDALLTLQVDRVHHPLGHVLVGAEDAGLPQHGVHEGSLAVVDVSDDRDVTDIGALRHAFHSTTDAVADQRDAGA
jgi:hypothetical protein